MKKFLVATPLSLIALILLPAVAHASSEIVRERVASQGRERSYYLYVPRSVTRERPAPLLVLLHGSGRNGRILVEHWRELAEREGIILAGPDARNSSGWFLPQDGPEFMRDLIEALKARHPINPRRVYLFGHSAGAGFSLYMAVMESQYFAAVVAHAGRLPADALSLIEQAERKIPVALIIGDRDPLFPGGEVRRTRDAFHAQGFPVELTEIAGHDHNYYGRSREINRMAWNFLQGRELPSDPQYKEYRFRERE